MAKKKKKEQHKPLYFCGALIVPDDTLSPGVIVIVKNDHSLIYLSDDKAGETKMSENPI